MHLSNFAQRKTTFFTDRIEHVDNQAIDMSSESTIFLNHERQPLLPTLNAPELHGGQFISDSHGAPIVRQQHVVTVYCIKLADGRLKALRLAASGGKLAQPVRCGSRLFTAPSRPRAGWLSLLC